MNDRCWFDRGNDCGILVGEKNCESCKFFKTEAQYNADYRRSLKILADKGLEGYMTSDNRISTRKIAKE